MKTLIALLSLLAITAGAQTLTSTNVIPFAYQTGTNNSYQWIESVTIPRQRLLSTHAGITNFNALGRSNVIIRLQAQIGSDWTTIDTLYPSGTNANISDSHYSTSKVVSVNFRLQLVTTNLTGVGLFRQQLSQQ